jgi:SAM-dependent methyltransferase
MNPRLAGQFRQPRGLAGWFVSSLMLRMNAFVYPAIEAWAGFRAGQRVLEIGYGPGDGIRYLCGRHDLRMDGIDFSHLMRRRASRRNRRLIRSGQVDLIQGDFLRHDFGTARYDRIIFANVSYFWADLEPPFTRIHDLLAEGGSLVFYMADRSVLEANPLGATAVFHRHATGDVLHALERAGFSQVSARPVRDGSGKYLVVQGVRGAILS